MKNWKPDLAVVIPTCKRPEFLALTLEKLSQTRESESADVRIFLDSASPERLAEVEYVRDTYLPVAEIFRAHTHVVAPSGTWNILNALKAGYETGAEYVFLVEEDVMICRNFFDRHREMQASGDYFVTCGRRYGRMPIDFYSNPGTCYRREKLAHVIPHIDMPYFVDLPGYTERHFPNMADLGILDDGLIRRVMRSVNGKAICADPPCAVHQGFHYYDKLEPWLNRTGSIQERIARLRNIIAGMDPMARYSKDFEPFKEE
jgi:hypothetical protein